MVFHCFFFKFFYEGFQQTSRTPSLQQQALAAVMKGLHTKMERSQQTSVPDYQSIKQTILRVQMKEGKPFSQL